MIRCGQSKAIKDLNLVNPMVIMPGFEMMKKQQKTLIKVMTGGLVGSPEPRIEPIKNDSVDGLDDIRLQLMVLREKFAKM